MKNWFFYILFSLTSTLAATQSFTPSDDFYRYHIRVATQEIEDEDIFYLIEENVKDLKNVQITDYAAKELLNLIEEGFLIDPFNMAALIETLKNVSACDNATKVILKAIEYNSPITTDHMVSLIKLLGHVSATDNATKIILKAIEYGIKFGAKERIALAKMSKDVSARSNVEKIRKALHERETGDLIPVN